MHSVSDRKYKKYQIIQGGIHSCNCSGTIPDTGTNMADGRHYKRINDYSKSDCITRTSKSCCRRDKKILRPGRKNKSKRIKNSNTVTWKRGDGGFLKIPRPLFGALIRQRGGQNDFFFADDSITVEFVFPHFNRNYNEKNRSYFRGGEEMSLRFYC